MNIRKTLPVSLFFALSLSLLNSCGPNDLSSAPTPSASTPSSAPSESPSSTPSMAPSSAPSESPSSVPSTAPSTVPSEAPSSQPSSAPSAAPSAAPTLEPDISIIEKTTFNGKVFDDTHAPLDGVTVIAKSLNSSLPYEATTTTAGGTYSFNNAPAGVQLEIKASKPGFSTRQRVEVLKSNKQGDPNANRYDFGNDGASTRFSADYQALSDLPEVVQVSPGRNASGVNPATNFVLTFSESMDKNSVEENFIIRSFTQESLSVDNEVTFTAYDKADGDPAGSDVWDENAFDLEWNSDQTQLTLKFSNQRQLPTDKDTENIPDYLVNLDHKDGRIKDKSGVSRSEDYFKLTSGNFEKYYKFSVLRDQDKPEVDRISANTLENGNTQGDQIRVVYSEPMVFYTLSHTIGGGINGNLTEAAAAIQDANGNVSGVQAAANYMLSINNEDEVAWDDLGGGNNLAIFDSKDNTGKTVLLRLANSADDIFNPGDRLKLTVRTTVTDPAGNTLDSSNDEATATAN